MGEEADARANGAAHHAWETEHAHLARVRNQERREHPQKRRLAGAVGPEHGECLRRLRGEADTAQGLALAEAAHDPVHRIACRRAVRVDRPAAVALPWPAIADPLAAG